MPAFRSLPRACAAEGAGGGEGGRMSGERRAMRGMMARREKVWVRKELGSDDANLGRRE